VAGGGSRATARADAANWRADGHGREQYGRAGAISYLTAIRGVAEAIPAKAIVDGVKPLIDDQIKAAAKAMGVAPEIAVKKLSEPVAPQLELGDGKYVWKPWRDVVPPHPDVMAARFVEAEFAADLSTVARGEGADTYRDPREFPHHVHDRRSAQGCHDRGGRRSR
jgi:hypothetical protein